MDIAGRGIVVTGAGRGIGEAIAERMVAGGARVVVNDVDAAEVQRVADRIGAVAVPGDAASEVGVADLIERAREELGAIDVYFANAGVETTTGLDSPESEWARSLDVNVMAHVRAARLLVPGWLEAGEGRFVVTASAAGLLTMLASAPYAVTKHAAVAFAEWLSMTYGHRGITVQALCPQGVNTRMVPTSGPLRELLTRDGALEPAEVAEAVWEALQGTSFLILPHPQVHEYYVQRATNTDRWLGGMRKIQRWLDAQDDPNGGAA
jgi:NAD(P)-dependent dehydrogenase (short-subunit alcohol dehydrogenase family)